MRLLLQKTILVTILVLLQACANNANNIRIKDTDGNQLQNVKIIAGENVVHFEPFTNENLKGEVKVKNKDDKENDWIKTLFVYLFIAFFFVGVGFYYMLKDKFEFSAKAKPFAYFIAKVVSLSPEFSQRQKEILAEFKQNTKFPDFTSDVRNILIRTRFIELSKLFREMNENFSHQEKKTVVQLLFKLAAADDGIQQAEWDLIVDIMKGLKISKATVEYMYRRFGPLRTFQNDYSQYYKSSDDKTKQANARYASSSDYALLGLTDNATKEEVQQAYHKLAMEHHPDLPKNANRHKECVNKMAAINVAYERIISKM